MTLSLNIYKSQKTNKTRTTNCIEKPEKYKWNSAKKTLYVRMYLFFLLVFCQMEKVMKEILQLFAARRLRYKNPGNAHIFIDWFHNCVWISKKRGGYLYSNRDLYIKRKLNSQSWSLYYSNVFKQNIKEDLVKSRETPVALSN